MAELIGLVVYDSVLYGRGRMVRRWADGVERQFTMNAQMLAPVNKRGNKGRNALPVGALAASISGSVERVGPKHLQTDISVAVPYATFVIKGTGSPIVANGTSNISPKGFMFVPSNPGYGTRTRQNTVSGQRANDFLSAAGRATSRTHPSLRGFESSMFEQF